MLIASYCFRFLILDFSWSSQILCESCSSILLVAFTFCDAVNRRIFFTAKVVFLSSSSPQTFLIHWPCPWGSRYNKTPQSYWLRCFVCINDFLDCSITQSGSSSTRRCWCQFSLFPSERCVRRLHPHRTPQNSGCCQLYRLEAGKSTDGLVHWWQRKR